MDGWWHQFTCQIFSPRLQWITVEIKKAPTGRIYKTSLFVLAESADSFLIAFSMFFTILQKAHQTGSTLHAAYTNQTSKQVNERSQAVHFRKYNYWWATNCRRMKKSMRSRLRWNEETWTKNVEHCCIFTWVLDECSKDSRVPWLGNRMCI